MDMVKKPFVLGVGLTGILLFVFGWALNSGLLRTRNDTLAMTAGLVGVILVGIAGYGLPIKGKIVYAGILILVLLLSYFLLFPVLGSTFVRFI